jgi:murein DD-endopeptidase MepM/ murein hydrolase activator NlpD
MMATEVSTALGIKRKLEGPSGISDESPVAPTYRESIEEYNFLKTAKLSRYHRNYLRQAERRIVPSLWPVNGRLLSGFGGRTDPFSGESAIHAGVDISATIGTPVKATADGMVYHAEYSGRYGRLVVIDHGGGLQTWYAHLSRFNVIPGQEIHRGDVIGLSGATGKVTSPHLHYEVRNGGAPVNPYKYLRTSTYELSAKRDFPF